MSSVLCVCAHQDDDAFIASRLWTHRCQGDKVRIVFTSSSIHKGIDYKNQRISESRNALNLIGIGEVDFLDYPDGMTYQFIGSIIRDVQRIISEINPSVIYLPAYEGGHIDHDVVNFCVAQAAANSQAELMEFPMYSGYNKGILPFRLRSYPPETPALVTRLSANDFLLIRNYWKCYPSQYYRFLMYVHLTSGFRKAFGFEYLRHLPPHDYLMPPIAGAAYEKYLKVTFNEFRNGVEQSLSLSIR